MQTHASSGMEQFNQNTNRLCSYQDKKNVVMYMIVSATGNISQCYSQV